MRRQSYGQIVDRLSVSPGDGIGPAGALPDETLYLPFIAGPHRLALGLVPLPSAIFELDCRYPAEMALRAELLDARHDAVFAALPGSEQARREVLESVAGELSAQHPTWFPRHGERLENRLTGESWDLAAPACDPLELAGRLVQEDLCILQPLDHDDFGSSRSKIMNVIDSNNLERDAGEKPVPTFSHPALAEGPILTAAILCFPSRWRLADKIGRGIAAIHAPVPGFAGTLAAPVGRVLTQLQAGHVVGRLNWSIVDDSVLHQPGGGHCDTGADTPVTDSNAGQSLFLRVERQTLSRLPESGAVLFTIRVHVYPLGVAITTRATAGELAAAVRALPHVMQRYKRFLPFRDALLAWLDAAS